MPLRTRALILAGGLVLFLAVGIRQGFGLFQVPVVGDIGISRQAFSFAVALQYLVWGLTGPLAARLARRIGDEPVIGIGGLLYASGFFAASLGQGVAAFVVGAGLLIGLGLGMASYGIVNGLVSQAVASERRGSALGAVGAISVLGQLLLLGFTAWTLDARTWRLAFQMHAGLVLLIVPLAFVLRTLSVGRSTALDNAPAIDIGPGSRRDLALLCLGFAMAGFQVMFTMTHLPAMLADAGSDRAVATVMLAILSFTSFVGAYLFGRAADRFDKRKLLASLYLARGTAAAAFPFLPSNKVVLAAYFFALGFVWMSTIPVASALTADLFGARRLAMSFGWVFLAHQVGGFCGTWLGGAVVDLTGSYDAMFALIVVLCAIAAVSTRGISAPRRHTVA